MKLMNEIVQEYQAWPEDMLTRKTSIQFMFTLNFNDRFPYPFIYPNL